MNRKVKTLEEILEKEKKSRHEDGQFGINACKESIKMARELFHESYYQQLEKFVKRANEDVFFNDAMVLACWELINDK